LLQIGILVINIQLSPSQIEQTETEVKIILVNNTCRSLFNHKHPMKIFFKTLLTITLDSLAVYAIPLP